MTREELRAAERAIVSYRFGGSGAAYRGALARAGASRAIARGVIADELRQARIERRFQVTSAFRRGRSPSTARRTRARLPGSSRRRPPRRGSDARRGVAIEGMAPAAVFRIPARRS